MTGLIPWSGTNHATLDFSGPDSSQSLEWVQTPSENEQFVACIAWLTNLRCGARGPGQHMLLLPTTPHNSPSNHIAKSWGCTWSQHKIQLQFWIWSGLTAGSRFCWYRSEVQLHCKKNIHNMVKMVRSCAYIPPAITIGSCAILYLFLMWC